MWGKKAPPQHRAVRAHRATSTVRGRRGLEALGDPDHSTKKPAQAKHLRTACTND